MAATDTRKDWTDKAGTALATVAAPVAAEIARQMAQSLAPGLYVVATPIGNLGDITLRAIAVLARVDVVYCEDTRHSRTLTAHYAIPAALKPYHEHNAEAARPEILALLAAGKRIALVADAGTPLISDPGFKLVREAAAAGHAVFALPGASAVLAGVSVAGLPSDAFLFAGFLPPKPAGRQARLRELACVPATLVLFEAPSRIAACLGDIAIVLGERETVVAREMTKLHEEVRRGRAANLAAHFGGIDPRGEFVVLIAPPTDVAADDAAIRQRLETAFRSMSVRDAAQTVAEALGIPRGRVYDLALAMKRSGEAT